MKQHITVKQWHELSVKGKGTWNDGRTPTSFGFDDKRRVVARNLPTIGQMIEFLDKHWHLTIVRQSRKDGKKMKKPQWGVFDVGNFFGDNLLGHRFIKLNLVDALWEAVKDVLEKEVKND